jgi:hypothetical protein
MVIFIPVNQGFAYRYFLQTKIFLSLQKNAKKIVIFVPSPDDSFYDTLRNYPNVILEDYESFKYDSYLNHSKFQKALIYIRSAVQNESFDITTTKEIYESNLKDILRVFGNKPSLVLSDIIIKLARKSYFLRKVLFFLENNLFNPTIHKKYFIKYRPDILLVSSVGTFHYDQYFMRQAKSFGAKVVTTVLSWDNSTTRGAPGAFSDLIISWTSEMKRELVDLNDIKQKTVEVGGVAHYDYYFDNKFTWSRKELLNYFDISAHKKIILFATKSPNCYSNGFIAEMIAKAIFNHELSGDCILLIRLHPIYYRKIGSKLVFQDQLNEIQEIASRYKNVIINEPYIETNVMNYSMPDKEIKLLGSLLKHSSIMVNMFSTLNIEASIFDTPIVNISFEDKINLEQRKKARFDINLDLRQTHNQRIVNSNGVTMVYESSKLIDAINTNLIDPNQLSKGRKKIVEAEVGPHRGTAGKRIASLIIGQV